MLLNYLFLHKNAKAKTFLGISTALVYTKNSIQVTSTLQTFTASIVTKTTSLSSLLELKGHSKL